MARSSAVRLARADEVGRLSEVLADAFDDDPVMRFLVPGGDRYRARLARLFRIELRSMLRLGGTWVVDDGDGHVQGVAVWAPPDRWKQSSAAAVWAALPALRVFGRSIRRAIAALGAMAYAHPEEPHHWYLSTLGTAAAHQGKGVGGQLLRTVLDRCDDQGLPAYLESSKPENLPYYARFGFEPRGELELSPGGPTIVPMWRDPGAG